MKTVKLSGPTSFAPIISKAIELAKERKSFHVLFIIADGRASHENEYETMRAIEEASNSPVTIVMVGVGDGPWDKMYQFNEQKRFSRFKFIDYHHLFNSYTNHRYFEKAFASATLCDIPAHFECAKF